MKLKQVYLYLFLTLPQIKFQLSHFISSLLKHFYKLIGFVLYGIKKLYYKNTFSPQLKSWASSLVAISYLLVLLISSCARAETIDFMLLASNLNRPVAITHSGDNRLFITEQAGQIKIIEAGQLLTEPFLNITDLVQAGGERGLLSLAFHPNYQQNGFFYVNYTNKSGTTTISRYTVTDNPNIADANSAKIILQIAQPFSNHNGGQIVFGPDGYLYIGTGDGGAGGDPHNNGQNLLSLLGKMLRIDVDNSVDSSDTYTIPEDNPFVSVDNAQPEIWAYGLRNPWRFSFDSQTGNLFIADVGQSKFEEVNFQPSDSKGGENYGWRFMEAESCFSPKQNCNDGSLTLPVLSYSRDEGTAITGGYVYHGQIIKSLQGQYIYGDFANGRVWAASQSGSKWTPKLLADTTFSISSFGEDVKGEIYLADYGAGKIYNLIKLID